MWRCISGQAENTTKVLGEIWTPDLYCSFITDKTLSYSVSADWDLKARPLWFVYKGSIPRTETETISTTHTKSKWHSMLTVKPSDLRPASQNRVNLEHPHQNQANQSPHQKKLNFRPHTVHFNSNTKTKPISISHTDQLNFDPITEIKSIRSRLWNQGNFDAPTQKTR